MESRISLALANKLRMLFEQNDKFLTYPQGIAFDNRYLSFMKDLGASGLSALEQLNNKGDFARLLNFIAEDQPNYSPDSSRFLWSVYKEVLVNADHADSALTATEEAQLAAAIAYLTDESTDSGDEKILVHSAAVRKYYEFKTSYDTAEIAYLEEKITVESTTGPEGDRLRQTWAAYREKQLREARDRAMQDWQNLGFKLAVENNQAVQRLLEPRKYLNLDGQAYLNDLELSKMADTNGLAIDFCTTFFSPMDVFDATTPWTRITMTRAEIETLVASAPANLKALFPGGSAEDGLVSLSFEYNNVTVIRPWFHPEFLASRTWQSVDNSVVSDGKVPRSGKIPAFVTSMLVVRNVTITRKAASKGQPVVIPIVDKRSLKDMAFRKAPMIDPEKVRPSNPVLLERPDVLSRVNVPMADVRAGLLKEGAVSRPGMTKSINKDMASKLQRPAPAVAKSSAMVDHRASMLDALAKLNPRKREHFIDQKYDGLTIKSPRYIVPPKQAEAAPAGTVTEPYAFSGVAVLAFICKRVPKAPDPDMTLTWG